MTSFDDEDASQAIADLRRMATIYTNRGHEEKAQQLLELADRIEIRLSVHQKVVNLDDHRVPPDEQKEQA